MRCQENKIIPNSDPDGDPLSQITRAIVELVYFSGSLYPTTGDRAWDVLRELVAKAADSGVEASKN